MKSRFLGALVLLGLSVATGMTAQDSSPQVLDRGPHSRVWQSMIVERDDSGSMVARTNRFTEIATGLHYVRDGQWADTKEEFTESADGFAATEGPHQVFLTRNINAPASVDLVMPDGQRLRSNPMGLSFFDHASGRNVLLGEVRDTEGALVAPNVVVYADCFTDVRASLRYTYTKSGFEQDVILHDTSGIGIPKDYGLPDTTLLEMYSEFYSPPVPAKIPQLANNGLEDQRLEFGQMTMGSGMAYVLGQEMESTPVSKTWTQIDGRDFLVESVPFQVVQPLLEKAGLQAGNAQRRGVVGGREKLVAMGEMKRRSGGTRVANATPIGSPPTKGFVIDYSTINSTLTNYVFRGDVTYHVTGPVVLSGTNSWWEGGCVIKYAATNSAKITANTRITWQASPYRPVVMTATDDQNVGNIVGVGALTGYYANTALYIDANTANTNAILQNLRVSYAQKAIAINGKSGHVLSHVQMVNCQNGIAATNAQFSLRNALFYKVLTNFTGNASTGRVEHLTVNTATWLNQNIGTNLYLTNCLLVAVTNLGSFNSNSVSTVSSPSGVFTSVGAGFHYLATNTYRNSGVTNVAILSDIQKMTTYPPLVNTNKYTNSITLSPQAQRDFDTPDRGYHYDPIDYALNTVTMTNATLVLTNGVAIAGFGNQPIWVTDGSAIYSEGSPLNRNHLTRYANVQEQSTNWGGGTLGSYLQLTTYNYGVSPPNAEFRFTDFDGLSGFGYHFYLTFTNWVVGSLLMKDCTLNSAQFYLSGPTNSTLALTNNLFERVSSSFDNAPRLSFFNNLYKNGELFSANSGTNNWTFRDNAFDSMLLVDFGTGVTNSHNAYINMGTNRFFPTNVNDKVLTSFNYTNGTLGKYYQLSTNLYDVGSKASAGSSGLYHYTVKASQVKETNSVVDIGLHYVALTSGQPTDSDGDGWPDYFEDRNGNGSADSGETDWQNGTDSGLRVRITEPKTTSNLP